MAALRAFEVEPQTLPFPIEPRLLERPPDRVQQVRRRNGLEHVGEGVAAHGRDRAFERGVSRDQHQLDERRARAERLEKRHSVSVWQAHVDQRHVEVPLVHQRRARSFGPARWPSGRRGSRRSPRRSLRAPRRRRRPGRFRSCGHVSRDGGGGENENEGSARFARGELDAAAVGLDDAPAERQPEAAPLCLGREQRLEDPMADLDRDSGAVVVDPDAWLRRWKARPPRRPRCGPPGASPGPRW